MRAPDLGAIDRQSLLYGRQDVRATWALYRALRDEYVRHPFATFEHERRKPKRDRYMGQLYSSASVAKQYLRLLNIAPLLQKQPQFNRRHLGKAAAAYFGGRADVRVRKTDVPVQVLDFTAMYATIFCLQGLHRLLGAPSISVQVVTPWVRGLLTSSEASQWAMLYDPKTWPRLNCLVLVDPNWAILPVRFRQRDEDPYTIAVTPLHTPEGRWYTLADLIASILLGGPAPKIFRAIRFVHEGRHRPHSTMFRGAVPLRSETPFFRPIVEQRQIAKRGAKDDPDLAALEMGLKQMAASGAYGIYAEINVSPSRADEGRPGDVYSDVCFPSPRVHDERPGAFTNPIIASLITGGARLMLAMLESEVTRRGGTFAFCDTDSLAIVCGDQCPNGIPCIPEGAIAEIVTRFNALSPYDPEVVPHLLKVEYAGIADLRCFAVSAKRYVLYRWRPGRRIQIVKASEAALGAIIGRKLNETTPRLARRIWLAILMKHLKVNREQRHRARPLIEFDIPMRRKFPISQPAILKRLQQYNSKRSYDYKVKPFGFVQSVIPATVTRSANPLPIAPYEVDLAKSKQLAWVDFNTGNALRLDWAGNHMDGTLPVTRLSEYVEQYQRHPEAKAADLIGNPAGPDTIGLLGRLGVKSVRLTRIGKDVDRLATDEGVSLEPDHPLEYGRDGLVDDIAYLARFSQEETARDLGLTARGWRNVVKGHSHPRAATAESISRVAEDYRVQRLSGRACSKIRGAVSGKPL